MCNIIPIVSDKIAALSSHFIRMPSTDAELSKAKKHFKIARMPAVIGAIDGSLVRIQEVGGAQNQVEVIQSTSENCGNRFTTQNERK